MDPQNQTPLSQPPQTASEKSVGPAVGIIIIIIIIVLGGLYFWGQRVNDTSDQTDLQVQSESVTPGANLEQLQTQSTSDDVSTIETDLNATNLDSLGTEVNSINAETQAQ